MTLQQMLLMVQGAQPPAFDPYWANVVLLLHFDGANGSGTFTDSSSRSHTITSSNSAVMKISTADFKFGTGSGSDTDTGAVYGGPANVPSADFTMGTGDFTIEWWQKSGISGYSLLSMGGRQATDAPFGFTIYGQGDTGYGLFDKWGTNIRFFSGGTNTGSWNFVTLNRVSGVWVGTFNGVVLTQSNGGGDNVPATRDYTNTNMSLGAYVGVGSAWTGNIDELRITKGIARYTGAHAVPTAAFPNSGEDPYFASVVMLLGGEGTTGSGVAGSGTFTDASGKAHHITSASNTQLYQSTANKKFGASSMFCTNGSLGHGTNITHADFAMGTGDFTVEWWGTHDASGAMGYVYTTAQQASTTAGMAILQYNTNFRLVSNFGNDTTMFSGGTSNGPGNFNYYALSRVSGVWYASMNGVLLTQSIVGGAGYPASRNMSDTTFMWGTVWTGGNGGAGNMYQGYIDEFRWTKGVGRYTAAAPVPTAAWPRN